MDIKVGDFVKGLPGADRYIYTTSKMAKGVVAAVGAVNITVKILEHDSGARGSYGVDPQYFEVIGHQKPFARAEVLELLKTGCKRAILDYDLTDADLTDANLTDANLTDADLTRANLTRANLDFSCLPLWCGGLRLKIDKRIACQLAYHLCSMQCEDAEYMAMRNSMLAFANQFHRVGECGRLKPIEEVTDAQNNT